MQDHPQVQNHAHHLNHLFYNEYNCALPAEFSNLTPSKLQFSRSRVLDHLVIAEALKALTHSEESSDYLKA